jgi:hypothetical protein
VCCGQRQEDCRDKRRSLVGVRSVAGEVNEAGGLACGLMMMVVLCARSSGALLYFSG